MEFLYKLYMISIFWLKRYTHLYGFEFSNWKCSFGKMQTVQHHWCSWTDKFSYAPILIPTAVESIRQKCYKRIMCISCTHCSHLLFTFNTKNLLMWYLWRSRLLLFPTLKSFMSLWRTIVILHFIYYILLLETNLNFDSHHPQFDVIDKNICNNKKQ